MEKFLIRLKRREPRKVLIRLKYKVDPKWKKRCIDYGEYIRKRMEYRRLYGRYDYKMMEIFR